MDANGQLRMLLIVRLHQLVELLHIVVLAGVGDAEDGRDADGVVVHVVHDRVHVQGQMVLLKRHEAHLDVPVAAELLPAHLVAGRDNEVRALRRVDVHARILRQLLPAEQHPEAAQHARLGRADGGRAHGLLVGIRMPQVGDHGDAAVLEVGRHGVLVLVDGVLLHNLGHDPRGHGLHVGLAERGKVLRGVALDGQILLDHLVGDARLDRLVVHLRARHLRIGRLAAEDGREVFRLLVHRIENCAGGCAFFHRKPPVGRFRKSSERELRLARRTARMGSSGGRQTRSNVECHTARTAAPNRAHELGAASASGERSVRRSISLRRRTAIVPVVAPIRSARIA